VKPIGEFPNRRKKIPNYCSVCVKARDQSEFQRTKGDPARYEKFKTKVTDYYKTEIGRISRKLAHWNRIARMAGLPGVNKNEWLAILERYGNSCAYCGTTGRMTIDHVIPVMRGGQHAVNNIVPACAACNSEKHYKSVEDFIGAGRKIRLVE
jgi:5-methylcytosine-specific restriction endonuclease McrA